MSDNDCALPAGLFEALHDDLVVVWVLYPFLAGRGVLGRGEANQWGAGHAVLVHRAADAAITGLR
jgi:hypothetical protein